ncbi:MAG: asparagine synthase-related protein [Streptosporangiaceae bacterium]
MYFTLAVSAATPERCAALVGAAQGTDPRIMPIPGPAQVAWRSPDQRAAVLCWPGERPPGTPRYRGGSTPPDPPGPPVPPWPGASHAGTIWADLAVRGPATLCARTGLAPVDPVYLAEIPGAVVVSDRACWAAAVAGRLADHDPVMVGAFLSLGYPVGAATAFQGVRALGGDRRLRVTSGTPVTSRAHDEQAKGDPRAGTAQGAAQVAMALVEAIRPLGQASGPVELSLTGGKDSRLIAAALTAAGVPFRARTHGFADHPDVVIAGMIAGRLGVEHTITEPRPAGTPDEADVLARLRSAVLVSDGMLSAFENVGSGVRPDPQRGGEPVQAGGHGGELLRGGYAQAAWRTPAALGAARAAELFRRMTTRRLSLLRPGPAGAYLASLAPSAAAVARGPLPALDDFYLVNRAGRWSAAARQAYLLRSALVQPLFADRVVRAARAVPLRHRMSDRLHRDVLALLCPELAGLPLAGSPWYGEPRTLANVLRVPAALGDWRRDYGEGMAKFLRGYVLDHGDASPMFGIVRRGAAERSLSSPQADAHAVWALATLAALLSGDWLNARR